MQAPKKPVKKAVKTTPAKKAPTVVNRKLVDKKTGKVVENKNVTLKPTTMGDLLGYKKGGSVKARSMRSK